MSDDIWAECQALAEDEGLAVRHGGGGFEVAADVDEVIQFATAAELLAWLNGVAWARNEAECMA